MEIIIDAFTQGKLDAMAGTVHGELLFDSTQAHDDYILGLKTAQAEQTTQRRKKRANTEKQIELFSNVQRWE